MCKGLQLAAVSRALCSANLNSQEAAETLVYMAVSEKQGNYVLDLTSGCACLA